MLFAPRSYDVTGRVKKLANDVFDRSLGLIVGEDSPLTKVLNFVSTLSTLLTKVDAFRLTAQSTFEAVTGKILQFPRQVRKAVASAMVPVRTVVDGLERLEEARVGFSEKVQNIIDQTESALDFAPFVENFVAEHVDKYVAFLDPIEEVAIEVQTVVDTIKALTSSGGLGIDAMRAILLGYMRSLVPDAKASITTEGIAAARSLQAAAATRLSAILDDFDPTTAGEFSHDSATAALAEIPAVLDSIEAIGTLAAALLDGGDNAPPPLSVALQAVRQSIVDSTAAAFNGLNLAVAEFAAGIDDYGSPLATASLVTGTEADELLDHVAKGVLPVVLADILDRLQRTLDTASVDAYTRLLTEMNDELPGLWEDASAALEQLVLPTPERPSDARLGDIDAHVAADGSVPSVWARLAVQSARRLASAIPSTNDQLNARAVDAMHTMHATVPSVEAGSFASALRAQVAAAAASAAPLASPTADLNSVPAMVGLWASTTDLLAQIGTAAGVAATIAEVNALGDDLSRDLGRTNVRDVLSSLEGGLQAMNIAIREGDALRPGALAAHGALTEVVAALQAFNTHVLEVGIARTWVDDLVNFQGADAIARGAAAIRRHVPSLVGNDDAGVDAYLAGGMANVRESMSVDALVAMSGRLEAVAVASYHLAAAVSPLSDGGFVHAINYADIVTPPTLADSVNETMVTRTVDAATGLVAPLAAAHTALYSGAAIALQYATAEVDGLDASLRSCGQSMLVADRATTQEHAAVRSLLAGIATVKATRAVGDVTATQAYAVVAPAHALESVVDAGTLDGVGQCIDVVVGTQAAVWPSLKNAGDLVARL